MNEHLTIPAAFFDSENDKALPALLQRTSGKTHAIKRGEFEEKVKRVALGLVSSGIKPFETVAILSENSPEWIISDLAISGSRAISVPIYTTLGQEEKLFILKDSNCVALIFSAHHRKSALAATKEIPSLRVLIETGSDGKTEKGVIAFEEVEKLGATKDPVEFEKIISAIEEDDIFSVIYSSGTTGRPKGVVITHKNILSNIKSVLQVINIAPTHLYLSYLPLSHVFERMIHHLLVYRGAPIAYSRGFAYVGADITEFAPSLLIGVPFFLDRAKHRILSSARESGILKRILFDLAMKLNKGFLDSLVLEKIREKAFPGVKLLISGGAALNPETASFFGKLGIPVLQGYGLTETSTVVTVNTPEDNRLGTVGKPVPGVEVKINPDKEILVKGPNVMKGYLNMPELTAEVLRDGWFYTGDTGSLDRDGYLTITGRKKDLIITSVGKNISPQLIETRLKSDPLVKEALVYGDNRPHLVALIVPEEGRLKTLAIDLGVNFEHLAGLRDNEKIRAVFEKIVRDSLKDLGRFEQIRKFSLIEEPTPERGEMTPTMKLKREKVAERHKNVIERLYAE
ncbi:MAG TPA: AMP-dependent synthetase/ligase [Thermodesulfobacteriota bacterium]|nr:AMP-dependent synthetase/ligase [Thermodesulfobacteriota bacterium]